MKTLNKLKKTIFLVLLLTVIIPVKAQNDFWGEPLKWERESTILKSGTPGYWCDVCSNGQYDENGVCPLCGDGAGSPIAGDIPISEGTLILLSLALSYSIYILSRKRNKKQEA